ncbi:MAG: serine protein kinase RIO [Candidatus Syntropharchaeia archaeon]
MREKKLQKIEDQIEHLRMKIKDSNDYKVLEDVFDTATLETLYKFANRGIISAMGGAISTGKEANIFHALGENGELAVKIYRISTSNFHSMHEYMIGDPRFKKIRKDKKSIVFAWTKKEFRNLTRASEVGVRVPEPIAAERNILIMEFIGKDGIKAPRLKDVDGLEDPHSFFRMIVKYMKLLYTKARIVHADLSEFNILVQDEMPVFIDMGQSVMLDHPNAEEFLERDVENIVRYFEGFDIRYEKEDIIREVRGI